MHSIHVGCLHGFANSSVSVREPFKDSARQYRRLEYRTASSLAGIAPNQYAEDVHEKIG